MYIWKFLDLSHWCWKHLRTKPLSFLTIIWYPFSSLEHKWLTFFFFAHLRTSGYCKSNAIFSYLISLRVLHAEKTSLEVMEVVLINKKNCQWLSVLEISSGQWNELENRLCSVDSIVKIHKTQLHRGIVFKIVNKSSNSTKIWQSSDQITLQI